MKLRLFSSIAFLFALIISSSNVHSQTTALLSPINTSVCVPLTATVQWANPANHFKSKLMIATDSSFSNIIVMQDSLEFNLATVNLPNFNAKYYWKVIAYKFQDTATSHSAIWSFTTKNAPILLSSPANTAYCIGETVDLSWDTIPMAPSYRVEYSTDMNFPDTNRMAHNFVVGGMQQIFGLKANTRYYWRVRGNYLNCEGYWSAISTYMTKPAPVVLSSPAKNAMGIPLFSTGFPFNPELKWHPVANANHYELQLSDSANFNSMIINKINIYDTTFTVLDTLHEIYNKDYFWRVKAVINIDTVTTCPLEWSMINQFKTPYKKSMIVSPTIDETCVSLTTTLNWMPIASAKSYTIILSSALDFSDTLHIAKNYSDTIIVFPLNREMKDYFWKVQAKDSSNVGYWSNTSKFTTTLHPAKGIFPADSATGLPNLIHFVWADKDTNSVYQLQVSEQANFATLLLDTNNLIEPTFSMNMDLFNKVYYWRLKTTKVCTSDWSKPMRFKTFISAPVLTSPADSTENIAIFPTFKWNPVVAAATYEILVDTSMSFNTSIGRVGIPSNEIRILVPLTENTRYFWKVRALNQEGTGPWSNVFTFKTAYILPDAPTLVSPKNESRMHPTTDLKLVWNSSYKAISYQLQVTKLIEFSNLIVDTLGLTDTTFTISGLDNFVVYQFRVRAINEGGISEWSAPFSFRTINVAPDMPASLVSPANEAINQPINMKLIWLNVKRAEAYHFQMASDKDFTSIINEEKVIYVIFKNLYDLDYQTTYFWRVKGWNEAGEGPWSETYKFTTTEFVSVQEQLAEKYSLTVSPNPSTSFVDVNMKLTDAGNVNFSLFNSNGVEVYTKSANFGAGSNSLRVDLQSMPSGAYFWSLTIGKETANGHINLVK